MMSYKFTLTEEETRYGLSIRKRTTVDHLPQEIGRAYQIILQYLEEIGEKPLEAAYAGFFNMDMQDLDVEMGFIVDKPLQGKGEIQGSKIHAGKQVSCLYKGPYDKIQPVYNEMLEWIKENGHMPTGTAYEFYYNSPQEVPESELLTKVIFPLK